MSEYAIVPAEPRHLPRLAEIERAAGRLFPPELISPEMTDYVTPPEEFEEACTDGNLWVAVTTADEPVGFALVEDIDGHAHLEEVDVSPAFGRRGIGRRLVLRVLDEMRGRRRMPVTLTTFRDIPWNAPFYASLGFRILAETEQGPELAALVREEGAHGLDPALRVVMIHDDDD